MSLAQLCLGRSHQNPVTFAELLPLQHGQHKPAAQGCLPPTFPLCSQAAVLTLPCRGPPAPCPALLSPARHLLCVNGQRSCPFSGAEHLAQPA